MPKNRSDSMTVIAFRNLTIQNYPDPENDDDVITEIHLPSFRMPDEIPSTLRLMEFRDSQIEEVYAYIRDISLLNALMSRKL